MLKLFFFTLFLPFIFVNGSPYTCTELSTSYSQSVSGDNSASTFIKVGKFAEIVAELNFTYFAKYNLFGHSPNASFINLYDVRGFETTLNAKIKFMCYWFADCHPDLTSPVIIKLIPNDPFVRFDINFGTNETFFIDGFMADNGTLTHWNGKIFTPSDSCYYDVYTDVGFVRNRTTCCTKFSPGVITTAKYPRCKFFKSRTNVYKPDFSFYGTSSVNYTLAGNQVMMNGNWAVHDNFGFELANKFFQSSDPAKKFSMNFTLPSGDSKIFFTTLFIDEPPHAVQDVVAFIIDGNNTLMHEDTPYTKHNDCSYHSFPTLRVGVPLQATVEICCKAFET